MIEVLTSAPEYRFGGHQSFALRIAWLPKAVAAIEAGLDPLTDPIVGVIELGLGKNMVEALRCWIEAYGVAERAAVGWRLTPGGAAIFGRGGHDPFLKDTQTLWWLHWTISTRTNARFFAWELLIDRWSEPSFSPSIVVDAFLKEAERTGRRLSPVSARQHFDVWLHSYLPGRSGRGEVSRQLATSEDLLGRALTSLTDVRSGGGGTEWFHDGARVDLPNGRAVVSYLSKVCDEEFDLSPIVRNELINRRTLSTAAARARYMLFEALSTRADAVGLGIADAGTPPERAMYLSILKPGGVHAERDGVWSIDFPAEGHDPLRLRPALLAIDDMLRAAGDARVGYEDVIAMLRGGRFGTRKLRARTVSTS